MGDRGCLSGSHPAVDMELLPVHLGNIVAEGSHPLRSDARDLHRPAPPCLWHEPAQLISATAQVMVGGLSSRLIEEGRAPHPPRGSSSLPFFSFFHFWFFILKKHTHTQRFSQGNRTPRNNAPKPTPSAHFPSSRISPNQDPRSCGLT